MTSFSLQCKEKAQDDSTFAAILSETAIVEVLLASCSTSEGLGRAMASNKQEEMSPCPPSWVICQFTRVGGKGARTFGMQIAQTKKGVLFFFPLFSLRIQPWCPLEANSLTPILGGIRWHWSRPRSPLPGVLGSHPSHRTTVICRCPRATQETAALPHCCPQQLICREIQRPSWLLTYN